MKRQPMNFTDCLMWKRENKAYISTLSIVIKEYYISKK